MKIIIYKLCIWEWRFCKGDLGRSCIIRKEKYNVCDLYWSFSILIRKCNIDYVDNIIIIIWI